MKKNATSTMSSKNACGPQHRSDARFFEVDMVTRMTCILLVQKEYCKHMQGLRLQEYMSLHGHNEQLERATVRQPNTQADADKADTMEVKYIF